MNIMILPVYILTIFVALSGEDERTTIRGVKIEDLQMRLERFVDEEGIEGEEREEIFGILSFDDFHGESIDGEIVNFTHSEREGYIESTALILAYYAEWCPNCHRNTPSVKRLHEKYFKEGLRVVVNFLYSDPVRVRDYVIQEEFPFAVLVGSEDREVNPDVRLQTTHYLLRSFFDDYRRWGTPFYIIYIKNTPDVWYIVTGELIEEEVDRFLREHLKR